MDEVDVEVWRRYEVMLARDQVALSPWKTVQDLHVRSYTQLQTALNLALSAYHRVTIHRGGLGRAVNFDQD